MRLPFETFLRVRSAAGGAFSPDGRLLAFLLNESGVAQVYRLDEPGGEPVQLTFFTDTVRSVHWSPDGQRLLFSMDAGGSERTQLYLMAPDGSDVRPLTSEPEVIHTFGCWAPDSRRIAFAANRRERAYFDLYVQDVITGEERCVLERDAYFQALDWSPTSDTLLVRDHPSSFNQNLYLLDLPTGDLRPIAPHAGDARYVFAHFLPDARTLVLSTDQDRDFLALALLDSETGSLMRLFEEPADVEGCDLSTDGARVVFLVNREGRSEVIGAALEGGRIEERFRQGGWWVAPECRMAAGGSRVAVSRSAPTSNPQVAACDWETGEVTPWARASMGDLPESILVEPEPVRYPTHDGLQIPALLYRPRGAGAGPLPVVVHVHGGPESQDRPSFSAVFQYLVHRGYAVLAPNVRGSIGYGNAYSHMDDREKRYDALRDVEFAYHWLVRSGIGRPDRIAIMGGSYGGFTVLYCLTRQPELWAAGVDIVGVANFETFFKHTGPWRRHLRASEYGDPEKDRDLLRDLSPIHRVDAIRAPLMVIQGANDPRVPQEESDQMVEQLRARRHPVEYLLFEDEGHGITKIPNRIKAYTAVGEFLDRYLLTP